MSVDQLYEASLAKVRTFKKRPADHELLKLYGLFKQATFGDNNAMEPSSLAIKAAAKWDAWYKLKGMTPEEAKNAYVELVEKLSRQYV